MTTRRPRSIERLMRTVRKMQPGTVGGQSKVATPVSQVFQETVHYPVPRPPSA